MPPTPGPAAPACLAPGGGVGSQQSAILHPRCASEAMDTVKPMHDATGRPPPAGSLPQAFLEGDEDAQATIAGWVAAIVRFGGWRFSDPEGVVQEVLMKLIRIGRQGGLPAPSSLRSFVASVARYTCIDLYRREKHRQSFEQRMPEVFDAPGNTPDPERRQRERERLDRLRYIHQRLSADCRELWRLIYTEELPPTEAASRLSISVGNLYVRVHRCLERARAIGRQIIAVSAR